MVPMPQTPPTSGPGDLPLSAAAIPAGESIADGPALSIGPGSSDLSTIPSLPPPLPPLGQLQHATTPRQYSSPGSPMSTASHSVPRPATAGVMVIGGTPPPPPPPPVQSDDGSNRRGGRNRPGRGNRRRFRPYGSVSPSSSTVCMHVT